MILSIYKPAGWTSYDVVAKVRHELKHKTGNKKLKVGHAGTLDPLAEGLLLILVDRDTKKQAEVMSLQKEYVADIAFGVESETYDLEGPLKFTTGEKNAKYDIKELQAKIEKILPNYVGKISQTVPPYSAVHVNGQRLYKKARSGKVKEDDLPIKNVTVYSIKLTDFEPKNLAKYNQQYNTVLPVLTCVVTCGSGTYIRALAHDLGKDLGIGGVLIKLVRTRIGEYTLANAVKIAESPGLPA